MKKLFALCVLTGFMGLVQAQGPSSGQSSQQGASSSSGSIRHGGSSHSQYGSQQYGNQSQYNPNGTQNPNPVISDQTLTSQIQISLGAQQYQNRFSNVTVAVSNGNVTLNGTVNSQEDKLNLGSIVGGVSGVRSVNNLVTVQDGSQGYNSQNYNSSSGYSNGYQNSGNYQNRNSGYSKDY